MTIIPQNVTQVVPFQEIVTKLSDLECAPSASPAHGLILLMLAKMLEKRMIQISLLMWNIAFSMFHKWCRWNSWYQCCNADTISLFYLFSFHHTKTIWNRIWHQLWKWKRFYKINDVYLRITPEQQLAVMFFSLLLVVVGIISSIFDIWKSTWWNVWCQNSYITKPLSILSWTPNNVRENDFNLIENICMRRLWST